MALVIHHNINEDRRHKKAPTLLTTLGLLLFRQDDLLLAFAI